MENFIKFLQRLQEALGRGEEGFLCPICGSAVLMGRAEGNGHIHACCSGCGILAAE